MENKQALMNVKVFFVALADKLNLYYKQVNRPQCNVKVFFVALANKLEIL